MPNVPGEAQERPPDFLVIGHICKDLLEGGFTIGGTATYSGLTARNLGRRVGIITSFSSDLDIGQLGPDIEVVCLDSAATTTFQNIYHGETRQQFVHALAGKIGPPAVPVAWRRCPVVQIGPLVREVDEEIVHLFPHSLVGVTPQGWMRQWDETGRVSATVWPPAETVLSAVKALIFSEDDIAGDMVLIKAYAELTDIVVVTKGYKGSTVYHDGQVKYFPTHQIVEIDPTGAGDIYAAAYLVRLKETDDPYEAARFANRVATRSVEKRGLEGVPRRPDLS